MNYIPEMIKYRAFLDIQFGRNKDYEKKMLEANPLFCLEKAISRAMSAMLRTDGDSKHAEVARTMTGEVSLIDIAANMHGLQKAQGSFNSLFMAFIILCNSKDRLHARALTPDEVNNLIDAQERQKDENNVLLEDCKQNGKTPPPL